MIAYKKFNGTTFPTSDALPLVPFPLDDFDLRTMFVAVAFGDFSDPPSLAWDIEFSMDRFYLVPEPATGMLLGLSLLVTAGAQRSRGRR